MVCSRSSLQRDTDRDDQLHHQNKVQQEERLLSEFSYKREKLHSAALLHPADTHTLKVSLTETQLKVKVKFSAVIRGVSRDVTDWTFCLLCFQLHSETKWLPDQRRISAVRSVRTSSESLLFCPVATASVKTVCRAGGDRNKHRSVQCVREDLQRIIHLLVWS